MMIRAALRDLQARRRRFLVRDPRCPAGAGAGNDHERAHRQLPQRGCAHRRACGRRPWVVSDGAGPFTTSVLIDDSALAAVRSSAGVQEAEPILITRQAVVATGEPVFSILIGVQPGKMGAPRPTHGAPLAMPGEAVVDSRLDVRVGDTVAVAGRPFTVSGTVRSSLFTAAPRVVYVLSDRGRRERWAWKVRRCHRGSWFAARCWRCPTDGLQQMSPTQAIADAMEPLKSASSTIALVRTLLWLVATLVVGSVLYLNAIKHP